MRNGKVVYAAPMANTIDFLPYHLPFWYNLVDRIILTEGVIRFCWDMGTEDGLSTDGSTEFIRNFPDPENKITYIPIGRCDLMCDLRNPYLALIEPGDIFLALDLDEIMLPEDVGASVRFLRGHPEYNAVSCEQVMFWGDLCHYITDPSIVERIFRREADWRYDESRRVIGDGFVGTEMRIGQLPEHPKMLHFGWVRRPRRRFQKAMFTYRWYQGLHSADNAHLVGLTEADLQWEILLNHPAFNPAKTADHWPVAEYPGPWPEPYRNHPFLLHPELLQDEAEIQELEQELLGCA